MKIIITKGSVIEYGPVEYNARGVTRFLETKGLSASLPFAPDLTMGPIPVGGYDIHKVDETEPELQAHESATATGVTFDGTTASMQYTVDSPSAEAIMLAMMETVFQIAKEALSFQAYGYSEVEVADFPLLGAEVLQYNLDSTVGPMMRTVINRGLHTAASLAALLTPKIQYKADVLQARDNHVITLQAILSGVDPIQNLLEYDTTIGWPTPI